MIHADAPSYPLRRRFLRYALPAMLLGLGGLLFTVAQAVSVSVERYYREQAMAMQTLLLADMARAAPTDWRAATTSATPAPDLSAIQAALAAEADELGWTCARIHLPDGRMISADNGAGCPTLTPEDREQLVAPGDTVFREEPGPPIAWTVASLVRDPATDATITVLTTRPAAAQETSIGWSTRLWVGGLAGVLAAAIGVALFLVTRAQREIDERTAALNEARRSLARFVSQHGQARAAGSTTGARRLSATVLFLDIRDFSSFAEGAPPEEAAQLVEKVAAVAFAAVLANGGDVDRLLGDGLIAWFEGDDRKARAWRAVAAILAELRRHPLPRAVGLGLHDGEAVEATIGAAGRLDATILGRTVNVAARLCSAAAGGEALASDTMLPPPDALHQTGPSEDYLFKGQERPVAAARYVLSAPAVPPQDV
ncbi:adenylate/guanylate cyclase domain-containing protein [Acuticoccus kandeliae]|uniref:adenylate/guanylate cyclase domain-containing protein n=1 Tax=Acuticoccus kandeliae TaxID=2073160 RepID=UPI000D3ED68E|nr:adenylate/guanylate cyclase domain-containing protein [Acuticoccus kandeliae]